MSFAVEEVDTGPSGSKNRPLILDYIYQGEVQIYQEHLDSFLEVAQKLKIEGLINATDGEDSNIKPENLHDNLTKPKVVADDIEEFGFDGQVKNDVGRISRLGTTRHRNSMIRPRRQR